MLFLVALGPAALLWCALAVRRAWVEDPSREPRAARDALRRLIAGIVRRRTSPTTAELEQWRRLSTRRWKIESMTPTSTEVAASAGNEWAVLWEEVEERLFSRHRRLPEDWVERAHVAALQSGASSARFPMPKKRRHWLPLAIASAVAVSGVKLRSAEPGDWSARHEAALGFLREEKWGPAAAEETAAFLIHPREPSVVTTLRLELEKVGTPDPGLSRLVEGAWYDRAMGVFSPAEWEWITRGAAAAAGVGFMATVMFLYLGKTSRARRTAMAGAMIASGVAIVAFCSVRRYGPLANQQAAFVVIPAELRSIPSDIVARDQTVMLPVGTIAIVDRSFLGWDHVITRAGGSGWVRTESVVWLYRSRDNQRINVNYGAVARQ